MQENRGGECKEPSRIQTVGVHYRMERRETNDRVQIRRKESFVCGDGSTLVLSFDQIDATARLLNCMEVRVMLEIENNKLLAVSKVSSPLSLFHRQFVAAVFNTVHRL